MVVVAIISILLTMITTVVTDGRRQARQTDCKSNLRQTGIAILVYRGEHNGANPPWLSNLYPEYLDDLRCFVCKSDRNRGVGPIRPKDLPVKDANEEAFKKVVDNDWDEASRHKSQNDIVKANSYFYEFSAAECPWSVPEQYDLDGDSASTKWWEYKEDQMRYGDDKNDGDYTNPKPYSQSKMPIVRCYHHHREGRVLAYKTSTLFNDRKKENLERSGIAINIAYAGNVYVGPLWWEGMPDPGEREQ